MPTREPTTFERLKWIHEACEQRSACGRFIIRRFCMNPKWSGYWGLTYTETGEECPCRTEASAKTRARNIANAMAKRASSPPD
jgi:hypothetical protein